MLILQGYKLYKRKTENSKWSFLNVIFFIESIKSLSCFAFNKNIIYMSAVLLPYKPTCIEKKICEKMQTEAKEEKVVILFLLHGGISNQNYLLNT